MGSGQRIIERGGEHRPVGSRPLHEAAEPREVHRSNHSTVSEGIAVPVLDVGNRHVVVVAHEGDGVGVGAERRTREGQAPTGAVEGRTHTVAPRSFLAGVVDLVEDDETSLRQGEERLRTASHLLVGGHDAVGVGRDEVARLPIGHQVEAETLGGIRPLLLQMTGRGHDHQTARQVGHRHPGRGQGERRLAGAGGGHGEEIELPGTQERVQRPSLPHP